MRLQLGMRKVNKQIHGWNKTNLAGISTEVAMRGSSQVNFYITNKQEGVIHEGKEADGVMFEDRTG